MITRRALLAAAAISPASSTLAYMATPGAPVMPTRRGIFNYPPSGGGSGPSSTWSAADASANAMTLSNGGMTATYSGGSYKSIRSTVSTTSGKLYIEFFINSTNGSGFEFWGLASAGFDPTGGLGNSNYSCGMQWGATNVSTGFTSHYTLSGGASNNDVWAIAVDFAAGSVWVARNNVWFNSSNPATGSLPIVSFVPATVGALFAGATWYYAGAMTLQPTPSSQTYAPPSGFTAWG